MIENPYTCSSCKSKSDTINLDQINYGILSKKYKLYWGLTTYKFGKYYK